MIKRSLFLTIVLVLSLSACVPSGEDFSQTRTSLGVRNETPDNLDSGYPLLLIHGIKPAKTDVRGDTDATFGELKNYLEDLGFDVWSFNYDTAKHIEIIAGDLGGAIAEVLSRKKQAGYPGPDRLSIISHSMGGLVTRAYIQQYALRWVKPLETDRVYYSDEIDLIIMIAPPNHGSVWGLINYAAELEPDVKTLFDSLKFSSVEMIPGSDFLDKLNDSPRPLRMMPKEIEYHLIHGTKFTTIKGESNDGIVLNSSSRLSEWESISGYSIGNYEVDASHSRLLGEPGIAYIDDKSHPTWSIIKTCLEPLLSTKLTEPIHVVTWEKIYGGANDDRAYSVQQTDDGGYVIVSAKSYPTGREDFNLVKMDSKGNEELNRIYRGPESNYAESVQRTSDGGHIMAWETEAYDTPPYDDIYLLKIDSHGNEEWSKSYGNQSTSDDVGSIQQTSDGGFIIGGATWPDRGKAGRSNDVYLVRIDSEGTEEWSKVFGGPGNDAASSVQQTPGAGFIVAGYTNSYGAGGRDIYLIKTDSEGSEEWSKTYGSSNDETSSSVQFTTDKGYIIAGGTWSTISGKLTSDIYLVKTDSEGNEEWTKTYGGSGMDGSHSIQQTSDGGYILAGYTNSYGVGGWDFYLVKTDSEGNEEWSRTFGGSYDDDASSVQQTSDGGYIIAGYTESYNADGEDVYLVKTDAEGNVEGTASTTTDEILEPDTASFPYDREIGGAMIAAGMDHTIGLMSDGTVVATGRLMSIPFDVSDWTDIVQVAVGEGLGVGVKSDGTVVATGSSGRDKSNVEGWTDILQVTSGESFTVGVRSDGTVVSTGWNQSGQSNVDGWADIIQVAAGRVHTVGLRSDGTVVATGDRYYGRLYVDGWTDIIQVVAGGAHTVGLRSDGTVVATGANDDGQCDVDGWKNIVQVEAGLSHTLGVRSNGTVVATGNTADGRCDVGDWTGIVQVAAGRFHTVGLRYDGTVVGTGNNNNHQLSVDDWNLLISP